MYFDRFDIVDAWYLALSEWHGGQWSPEYARLSRMTGYFKPSPFLSVNNLSENGKEIYSELNRKFESGWHPTMREYAE